MSTNASSSTNFHAEITEFSELQGVIFGEDMNMPLLEESSLHRVCVLTTEDLPDNESVVSHESEVFLSQHMIKEGKFFRLNFQYCVYQ